MSDAPGAVTDPPASTASSEAACGPPPVRERRIEVDDGIAIRVAEWGSLDAESPIVFLHGLFADGSVFEPAIARLLEGDRDLRIATIDLRDHGSSDRHPGDGGYDLERWYRDLEIVLPRADLVPARLLGFSLGGFLALRLAARHPEWVEDLVLLGSSAAAETSFRRWKYRLLLFVLRSDAFRGLGQAAVRNMAARRNRDALPSPGWLERMHDAEAAVLHRTARAVIERRPCLDEVGRIACPVTFITGDADRTRPIEEVRATAARLPDEPRIETIPRCGHLVPLEQPEAFEACLLGHYRQR